MKTTKILPLLLVAPLLTGCGKSFKAPKLEDLGSKVEESAWSDKLNEVSNGNFLTESSADPTALKSVLIKNEGQDQTIIKIERGEKKVVVKEDKEYSQSKSEDKYDATNALYEHTYSGKSEKSTKTNDGEKYSKKSNSKTHSMKQAAKVDDKDYVVTADELSKQYSKYGTVSEENPANKVVANYAYSEAFLPHLAYSLIIGVWEYMSDEDKAEYSFYVNDKSVLSIVREVKIENEETKDASEEVVSVRNRTEKHTYQISFTANEDKVTYLKEISEKVEYKKDSGSYFAGDVYTQEIKSYDIDSIAPQEISLTAVDLSSYVKVGDSW